MALTIPQSYRSSGRSFDEVENLCMREDLTDHERVGLLLVSSNQTQRIAGISQLPVLILQQRRASSPPPSPQLHHSSSSSSIQRSSPSHSSRIASAPGSRPSSFSIAGEHTSMADELLALVEKVAVRSFF